MLRRLKREVCFLVENYRTAALCPFLCCMGGILLWVSGGSPALYLRKCGISAGALFLLWLPIYGLTGLVLAWIFLVRRNSCRGEGTVLPALCAGAYLCMLCWYAVYCCTGLVLFAGILLLLSIVLLGTVFIMFRHRCILMRAVILLAETGQILCLLYCHFLKLLI